MENKIPKGRAKTKTQSGLQRGPGAQKGNRNAAIAVLIYITTLIASCLLFRLKSCENTYFKRKV